jgi:hypothetical protein
MFLLHFNKNTVMGDRPAPHLRRSHWLTDFGARYWQSRTRDSWLVALKKRQGDHCNGSAQASVDRTLWQLGARQPTVPVEVGEWAGLHLKGVRADGAQLWSSAGVHHPALPAAEQHAQTCGKDVERTMQAWPSL